MVVVIDTREQSPLDFLHSAPGTLTSGDYSLLGAEHLFAVERKSIADLVGSLTSGRERFERELHRLRGFHFKRLLIEGTDEDIIEHRYLSKALPKSILHSLSAFEIRYDIPVVFGGSRERCARLVEKWAYWFAREVLATSAGVYKGILKEEA